MVRIWIENYFIFKASFLDLNQFNLQQEPKSSQLNKLMNALKDTKDSRRRVVFKKMASYESDQDHFSDSDDIISAG